MSKTGKTTPKEDKSLVILREMPKDHPLYKKGFIIGGRYTKKTSKATKQEPEDQKQGVTRSMNVAIWRQLWKFRQFNPAQVAIWYCFGRYEHT